MRLQLRTDPKTRQGENGAGGRWGVEGGFHVMHGRIPKNIDPSIRTNNAGTEHVECSQVRQTLLASSLKRHEGFGESHEG